MSAGPSEALAGLPWYGLAVLAAYFATLLTLSVYGLHRYHLLWLYLRHRRLGARGVRPTGPLPRVTVQLPLYNEATVARRLVEAVGALDYPADRLEIQVLDDSTDETRELVDAAVARLAERGLDARVLRREGREGFKAGALARGLESARGELVAVFDADFVPRPDFLRRVLPHLFDPGVGMVQVRWGHLNRERSLLTRLQALLLDGHFVIEHTARNRSGRFFNFNGTAGVWRRQAIESGGGWQHDTLTEDLDLSYRAQLAGWRFVYLPEVVAPAELPEEIGAFKSQQHRWAKGSVQTGLKLLPRILRAPLPLRVKTEAWFHLSANLAYLFMILLSILLPPAMLLRRGLGATGLLLVDLPLFVAAFLSVSAFYVVAARDAGLPFRRIPLLLPPLMALGIGLGVNNARAVIEALRGRPSPFVRTPKYGDRSARRYRARRDPRLVFELLLSLYFTGALAVAAALGAWASLPFLALFWWGYTYTGLLGLGELVQRARVRRSA
jgi:cellulose synthase/poly-beta-1,6-N-acetylglucosamine synthase-like glycosyltransferase